MHIPLECTVFVVTTDKILKPLAESSDGEQLKAALIRYWRQKTSAALPRTQILIVPASCGDRFHDRAIVTEEISLSMGQSQNGLGKARGNITILKGQDSKDLESNYVDGLLNNTKWFLSGVQPTLVSLGD